MERSDCCVVAPSRGALPGTPLRWLAAAWRDAAEQGGPACVLVPRAGVLVVAWANRALGALLGRDVADLVGRPLSELAEADGDLVPLSEPLPPAVAALLPVTLTGGPAAAGPRTDGGASAVGWARLGHHLARAGGGSGVGTLRQVDGASARVRIAVTSVDVSDPSDGGGPTRQGRLSSAAEGSPIPGQLRGSGPAATTEERATVPVLAAGGATVTPAGTVGERPASERSRCWLIEIEPVDDALAEAQSAVMVAEHRFTALAGCAPVGIFASEVGLRLGYVNDFFVGLTGTTANALLGTGWLDVVHRDDLAAVYTAVQTVLSGRHVELAVRLAVPEGVQRWLQLRLAPTTTPARAAGFIGTAEDVTDRRSWEEHLTYQAQHDPLTGLVNRRRLIEVLTELLSGRRGRDREFAVLFLDLDGFKEVNDTLGHDAGDRALIEVARRMQRVARESDLLARVAGDEFVVVLRHIADESEAEAAARRHLAALEEPVRIGAKDVRLSASIGVALPAGFDTPDSLLRAADRVMYEAKAAGHGLYRLAPVGPTREGR